MAEKKTNIDFDFRKVTHDKIEKEMTKIDFASYKKLAFLAVSVGVFVSFGVFTANNILPSMFHSTKFEAIVPPQQVIDNMNSKVSSISETEYQNTINYYQKIMNIYDNKTKFVSIEAGKYNLQKSVIDPQIPTVYIEDLNKKVNEHKELITDKISKLESYRTKISSKGILSYKEAQFFIATVENAKNNVFYQNSDVEAAFNKILLTIPTDVTKYYMAQHTYDKVADFDKEIKENFQTNLNINNSNSTNKPKM